MKRVLTAAILAPVAVAAVLLAPEVVFALLVLLVAFAGVREFYDLAQAQGLQPYRLAGLGVTAVVVMHEAVEWQRAPSLDLILVGGLVLILARCLSLPERQTTAVGDAGATILGVLYPGLLVALLGAIHTLPGGPVWLVYLMLTVWTGDIAALYAGKAWGRHAMAPRVSPHKTWEGAAASMAGSLVAGVSFGCWSGLGASGSSWGNVAMLGALAMAVNVAAQAGDLIESGFKRGALVKDSGSLLPGHGGVLDRMDALLFAAPVVWYYLYFRV